MTATNERAGELPELPEPWADTVHGWAYTADQMRAYALAALTARDAQVGELVEAAREALESLDNGESGHAERTLRAALAPFLTRQEKV